MIDPSGTVRFDYSLMSTLKLEDKAKFSITGAVLFEVPLKSVSFCSALKMKEVVTV